MKIEITNLTADVMQRLIRNEIEAQEELQAKFIKLGNDSHVAISKEIVKELEKLADDIEKNGIRKFYNYY